MSQHLDTDLAVKLEEIRSLAEVARCALPLGVNAIFKNADGLLVISKPPRPARLKFFAEDLQFNLAVSPEATDSVCQIWSQIGHVPYTVESADRRSTILTILRATRGLARARFVVESGQKILLIADSRIDGAVTPERLIFEVVALIQEARPYLRLLAAELN